MNADPDFPQELLTLKTVGSPCQNATQVFLSGRPGCLLFRENCELSLVEFSRLECRISGNSLDCQPDGIINRMGKLEIRFSG